jgi:hypothetical protein
MSAPTHPTQDPDPHALDPIPPAPPASLLRAVPTKLVPARPHGSYITTVGGYGSAGLVLHIAATVLTLGAWLPVFITYLIGWRRRVVTFQIADGALIRVDS